ncbi:MAG TPA: hypothetical protein VN457_07695, partial [Chlamydiales bacterium]|nr:hypothetical protein [Chlamydiales bacterium]
SREIIMEYPHDYDDEEILSQEKKEDDVKTAAKAPSKPPEKRIEPEERMEDEMDVRGFALPRPKKPDTKKI